MKPEEKAKEIWFQFFSKQIEVTGNGDGDLCVELAIIVVDEIIKSSPSLPILSENGAYSSDIKESLAYWQEVKREIEKL